MTDATLINAGLVALINTGVLNRFVNMWKDKPLIQRNTWLQFKDHFQPRILEYQKARRGAHLPQAHNTQYLPWPSHPSSNTYTTVTPVSSLPSQATAASQQYQETMYQANNAAMANMAATQTELLKQLTEMQEKLASLTAQAKAQTQKNNKKPAATTNANNQYCWTHGYRVGRGHTSATCNNRAPGHQARSHHPAKQYGGIHHQWKTYHQLTYRAAYTCHHAARR